MTENETAVAQRRAGSSDAEGTSHPLLEDQGAAETGRGDPGTTLEGPQVACRVKVAPRLSCEPPNPPACLLHGTRVTSAHVRLVLRVHTRRCGRRRSALSQPRQEGTVALTSPCSCFGGQQAPGAPGLEVYSSSARILADRLRQRGVSGRPSPGRGPAGPGSGAAHGQSVPRDEGQP